MQQDNSGITFAASIDECFAREIKKRGWSKNSIFDRKRAAYHKKQFLDNKLPYEVKKMYLEGMGYEIIQQELWNKKPVKMKKPKLSIIQPNAITMMSMDFTSIQIKVLILVIDKLQSTIEEILNGISFENTPIFAEIDSSNQVTIKINYIELGIKTSKYSEAMSEIMNFEMIPVIFENPFDEGYHSVKFPKLFSPEIPAKPYSRSFYIKMESSVLKQFVSLDNGFTRFFLKNALNASKYSARIYLLICMWKDAGEFQMNLDTFKKWLQIEDKYSTYQELYKSVIHPVYEELFEKMDCWFEMTESFNDGEIEPFKLNFKVIKNIEININN